MSHKDPAAKRAYMAWYHRTHPVDRKALKKACRDREYANNPEGVRLRWRAEKRLQRARKREREQSGKSFFVPS